MNKAIIISALVIGAFIAYKLVKREKYTDIPNSDFLGDQSLPLNARKMNDIMRHKEKFAYDINNPNPGYQGSAISQGADDCNGCIQKDATHTYIESQM